MNKFSSFGLCVAFIFSESGSAQITIDSADYGSIGDTVFIAVDSIPPGITAGPSGMQTWDFSSLVIDSYDTLSFISPADSNFPSSNLSLKSSSSTSFFIKTANNLSLDGNYLGSIMDNSVNFTANYEDNENIMVFPSTYMDSFSDTAKLDTIFRDPQFGANIDSARIIRDVYVSSLIDGYGLVKIPGDSGSSIRQKRVKITIDTLCFKGGLFGPVWTCPPIIPIINTPNPAIDTAYLYSWWVKGRKYPLIELQSDKTGDTVRVANFIIENTVTIVPEEWRHLNRLPVIFPNPSTDFFNILWNTNIPLNIDVIDVRGKTVFQKKTILPEESVSLSGIPHGVYLLRFYDDNGALVYTSRILIIE